LRGPEGGTGAKRGEIIEGQLEMKQWKKGRKLHLRGETQEGGNLGFCRLPTIEKSATNFEKRFSLRTVRQSYEKKGGEPKE